MGCCTSTTSKSAAENSRLHKQNTAPQANPLFEEEEEAVKEVLSETPTLPKKPMLPRRYHHERFEPRKLNSPLKKNMTIPGEKHQKDRIFKQPASVFDPEELFEDASEEVCSTKSECFLATAKKNGEDGADARQNSPGKLLEPSISSDIGRARVIGKSPAKKSNQSPNRVRSGPAKDVRGLGSNAQRKDSGERSGRRSVSPGSPVVGVGGKVSVPRSGSSGRNRTSPGRVKSEVGGKIRKLDNMSRSSRENRRPPTRNESLENPLVSLECFIFL